MIETEKYILSSTAHHVQILENFNDNMRKSIGLHKEIKMDVVLHSSHVKIYICYVLALSYS